MRMNKKVIKVQELQSNGEKKFVRLRRDELTLRWSPFGRLGSGDVVVAVMVRKW